MVPVGNKAKRLSSVNHATKTVHHQFIIIINNLFINHLKKLNIKLILSDIIEKKTFELSRVAPAHVWCYKSFLSCFDN